MLVFAGIFAAMLAVFVVLGSRDASARYRAEHELQIARKGAALRDQLTRAFQPVHDYRHATDADWAGLDRRYYEEATATLTREGFAPLADLVDQTLRDAFPRIRAVARVYVGDGGRVRVAVYHARMLGWNRALQLLGLIQRRIHVVECVSELDGVSRFVSTSNTLGLDHVAPPDAVQVERMPRTATVAEVLARHRERLAAMDRAVWEVMPDFEALLRSMQRGNVVVARHREGVGTLTEEELRALTGRPLTDNERLLLTSVRGAGAGRSRSPTPS